MDTLNTQLISASWKVSIKSSILRLTLSTPRGAHCAPPVTYLRTTVQIHVPARWKNLTFPNYEFGIGHYAFYPMKLSRFAEKKYSSSEIPKFHKGGPLQTIQGGHPDHSYRLTT